MLNLRISHDIAPNATITRRALPCPLLQPAPVATHPPLALARRRERIEARPARRVVRVAHDVLAEGIEAVRQVAEAAGEGDLVVRFDDGDVEHSLYGCVCVSKDTYLIEFLWKVLCAGSILEGERLARGAMKRRKLTRQWRLCHALIR